MQTKNTDSTINRPKGERVIDAPFVFADLEKYRKQLKKEDAWKKSDRNSITIYKTAGITIVLTSLHKKASIDNNAVDGLLTIQVLDGSIDFTVKNTTKTVEKDQLVMLHPDILHTIHAKEETTILLINKTEN